MEKGSTNGKTATVTMVNGKTVRSMVMEFGKTLKGIVTLDSGCKIWHMATAFMNGKMEIDMKVSGIVRLDMGKAQMYSQTAMCFWVNTHTAKQRDMVSIVGQTVTFIAACLWMVESKAKELGKNLARSKIRTCTKENITTI
jgi:hypothetical protein